MTTMAIGSDQHERLERVRRALVHVETAVGVRHVEWAGAAPPLSAEPEPRFDGGWLQVPEALRRVVPHGAIRRGSSVMASGSATLLLHLVAALAGEGAWSAVVAQPDLGLAAAIGAGIDPARLVLVPEPGPSAAEVMGAVVDGFDVVVVGSCAALSDRDRRAISQRVRHRGAVLVSSAPWPGVEVRLEAVEHTWTGLVQDGRLTGGRLVVRVAGRSMGGDRGVELTVSEHDGGTRLRAELAPGATRPVLVPDGVTPLTSRLIERRAG